MTELELEAIFFTLEYANNFTYSANTIEILTDHFSLKCLEEIPNPKITSPFNKISHYHLQINVLTRLPTCAANLQYINHYVPVQTITISAVQTRGGKLGIARDLVEMAARTQDDEDYPELIRKIETESDFGKLGQEDPHNFN